MALTKRQRRDLERRLRAALAAGWDGEADELLATIQAASGAPPASAGVWAGLSAAVLKEIAPVLAEAYLQSARQLGGRYDAVVSVNYDIVNQRAADWARQYGGQLVRGVTATTRERVGALVDEFFNAPEVDLQALGARLGELFNPARGDMIAVTEVTRASAQGELGLFAEIKRDNPSARIVQVWLTSQDELVCPVCGPRHGQRIASQNDMPPAHPRCRCAVGTELVL